jgi:hypothetical protein
LIITTNIDNTLQGNRGDYFKVCNHFKSHSSYEVLSNKRFSYF